VDGDLRVRHRGAGAEGVTLRRAVAGDLDTVVAVNRASATVAFAQIFGDAPYPEDGVRRRYAALLTDPDAYVFLAGELGYAAARPGRLEALYVVPHAWGTGVADALYEAASTVAGPSATLWVLRDNFRARRFWERRGWEPTGEEDTSRAAVEVLYRR
jgi:GNAT superfamily N-acetyltransferase